MFLDIENMTWQFFYFSNGFVMEYYNLSVDIFKKQATVSKMLHSWTINKTICQIPAVQHESRAAYFL